MNYENLNIKPPCARVLTLGMMNFTGVSCKVLAHAHMLPAHEIWLRLGLLVIADPDASEELSYLRALIAYRLWVGTIDTVTF
jgi:hypothetical protein